MNESEETLNGKSLVGEGLSAAQGFRCSKHKEVVPKHKVRGEQEQDCAWHPGPVVQEQYVAWFRDRGADAHGG